MPDVIPGLKLIYHNAGHTDLPDDPSFPFKLAGSFCAPDFMSVAFLLRYGGSEEIIVRSMTREGLDLFIDKNGFRTNPRLRSLIITGPDGVREELVVRRR